MIMRIIKEIILLLLALIFSNIIFGQKTAMFEHPLYFEDGIGNRDTLIIGGDTTASIGINPEFGEVPDTTPFDSVFEVRGINDDQWFSPNPLLLKKIIGWTEKVFGYPEPCEDIEFLRIIINIRHLPLKVSWDSKIYTDSACILATYITSSYNAMAFGPGGLTLNPEDENLAYCVAQHDSLIFDIGQGLFPGNLWEDFIYPVEGGTTDTMLVLEWNFDYSGSTLVCGGIVNTNEILPVNSSFLVYPNPAEDHLTIQWSDPEARPNQIRVFSSNGVLIQTENVIPVWDINYWRIETNTWIPGVYFLQMISKKGTFINKVIKI
jgi:hypothetical protein